MNILEMPGLWQLYTFCAVFWLFSIAMYGLVIDPCLLVTGKSVCNSGAESFTSRLLAIGLLYVGTLFFALTYINKDDAPKLKRLANMGMMCVSALLTSIIFFGPRSQGGFENSILHFLDLVTCFILLAIMISAIGDSSNMAGASSPLLGLGINPKSFIFFLAVTLFFKLIFLSEFANPSMFLADPGSVTAYSHVLWQLMIVIILMILFPILFALAYGDDKDQETITAVTIIMMVVSIISIIPMRNSLKGGMMTMSAISSGVVSLLALISIFVGRSSTRNEYESVSNVSTNVSIS